MGHQEVVTGQSQVVPLLQVGQGVVHAASEAVHQNGGQLAGVLVQDGGQVAEGVPLVDKQGLVVLDGQLYLPGVMVRMGLSEGCASYVSFEDVPLVLGAGKVSVVVQATFAHCDAFRVLHYSAQFLPRVCVVGLGVVRMNACNQKIHFLATEHGWGLTSCGVQGAWIDPG